MLHLKSIITYISLISLYSITSLGSQISEARVNQAAHRYLSIHENIEENTFDKLVELINRHPYLFNHLAQIETDPEFLPYIERYSNLKMRFTGRSIDPDIKVVFSNKPLNSSTEDIIYAGICDRLTRTIFIDRNFWDQNADNEKFREAILSQTMGFCDLNRVKEYFPYYIEVNGTNNIVDNTHIDLDFSFMSPLSLDLLFLPNSPTVTDGYNHKMITSIREARENLDKAFELMYYELFSRQNIRTEQYCMENVCLTPEEYLEDFKAAIPYLKHMTIGPSLEDEYHPGSPRPSF